MSFQGINFANQRLLPSDDGRLYQNIFNDGALYGCGITYTGTKLTIAQGHLVIGGRQIEIESAEVLDVNQAVSGFAQIVISIDLTKTATISTFNQISIEVRYAAAADGFSTLTQTDINGSGSYYEAQLALLSLGTGGITGIVQNMPQAAFKGAAEGGGLNLHVVGGTTQPENPQENIVWVNTDIDIHHYAFSASKPYGISKNKNLIPHPFYHTTSTISGVTYTDNGDGTVTANGTASTSSVFRISATNDADENHNLIRLSKGTYTFSGCPAGGSDTTYFLEIYKENFTSGDDRLGRDYGNGVTFTLSNDSVVRCAAVVASGASVSNLVFKPQLEKGSTATSFVKGDATGMVWFATGTTSSAAMNIDKKNSVMLYPTKCQQYVGGAWTSKIAKTYLNGTWADWWKDLYASGELGYELATGFTTLTSTTTVQETSAYIKYYNVTSTGNVGGISSKDPVVVTGYSTLKIKCRVTFNTSATEKYKCGLAKTKSLTNFIASVSIPYSATDETELNIPVPADGGEYYLVFTCGAVSNDTAGTQHVRISGIRLEA